jgi:mandelamide amidase
VLVLFNIASQERWKVADELYGQYGFVQSIGEVGKVSEAISKDSGSLLEISAAEAGRRIAAGEITAELYCAAVEARAEALGSLNILIARNGRLAEEARAVDAARRRGEGLGPLAGVPLLIKDNLDVEGLPTSAGTPALKDWRPGVDSPVVGALKAAGALVLGKANMHELAFGVTSDNARFGRVGNPWNPAALAGGSSGGTTAGIAGGAGPAGLGSDTAGSIRIPSALCGVCGLRTTVGRWSTKGVVPLSHSRDAPGPMARTMGDLALLDAVVTGEPLAQAADLQGVRLGVPRRHFWEELDAELEPVAEAALRRLADAGAVLVELDLGEVVATTARIGRAIHMGEVIADIAQYLADGGAAIGVADVVEGVASPDVQASIALALDAATDPRAYREAMDVHRPALRRLYAEAFAGVEALIFPTTPLPARPLGPDITVEWNGRIAPARPAYVRNIDPISAAGWPGLSLPIGLTASVMPVGLELDGPGGSDRRLIALGLAMERLFGELPPLPLRSGGA